MKFTIRYDYDGKYWAFTDFNFSSKCASSEESYEDAEKKLRKILEGLKQIEIPSPKTITI